MKHFEVLEKPRFNNLWIPIDHIILLLLRQFFCWVTVRIDVDDLFVHHGQNVTLGLWVLVHRVLFLPPVLLSSGQRWKSARQRVHQEEGDVWKGRGGMTFVHDTVWKRSARVPVSEKCDFTAFSSRFKVKDWCSCCFAVTEPMKREQKWAGPFFPWSHKDVRTESNCFQGNSAYTPSS